MQASLIALVIAENNQIQQLNAKSDPELINQSHSHLLNLVRAMEKANPGDSRYKLALTTLYQYDKHELSQMHSLYSKQWEDNVAKTTYVDALKSLQCTIERAVTFII